MTTRDFLRALPAHGFAPPEAGVAVPGMPGADSPVRSAEVVAAFAAGFWERSPAAREAAWEVLAASTRGPAAARVAELRPGLAVVPVVQTNPDAAELAALVRELFTLPPKPRAVRRFTWLADRAGEFRRWVAAGRVVLRTDLALAKLEPRLFDWLMLGKPPERVDYQTWVEARDRWRAGRRRRDRITERAGYFVGVVFVLMILFFAYTAVTHPANRTAMPMRVTTPPLPPADPMRYTADEVRAFRDYDRDRFGPAPGRWRDWVTAGRPPHTGAP